jgi:hypothetical protein
VCLSVASVIQHAKRMRRIILSSVACLYIFFTIINCAIFGGKVIEIKRVLILSTVFVRNFSFILKRIQRDAIVNTLRYSCKVPVILVRF